MTVRTCARRSRLLLVLGVPALVVAVLAAGPSSPAGAQPTPAVAGPLSTVAPPPAFGLYCPDVDFTGTPVLDPVPGGPSFLPTTATCGIVAGPALVGVGGGAQIMVPLDDGGAVWIDQHGLVVRLDDPSGDLLPVGAGADPTSFGDGTDTAAFSYDAAGELTTLTETGPSAPAAGDVTTFIYDADGNLTSETGPAGTTTFGYDPAELRLTSAATGRGSFTFTYDALGELTGSSDGTNSAALGYDADGRLLGDDETAGSYSFTYDADGRLASASDPSGANDQYTYDGAGELASAARGGEPVPATYEYNLDGELTATFAGGAGGIAYRYDAARRLVEQQFVGEGGVAFDTTFTYDADGDVTGNSSSLPGNAATVTSYTYDADGRLTSAVQGSHAGDSIGYGLAGTPLALTPTALPCAPSAPSILSPLPASECPPDLGSADVGIAGQPGDWAAPARRATPAIPGRSVSEPTRAASSAAGSAPAGASPVAVGSASRRGTTSTPRSPCSAGSQSTPASAAGSAR